MRLIHIIPGLTFGGRERYALDICSHFALNGHEVIALTRDAKVVDTPFARAGISLRHAPLRDYPDIFSSLILKRILQASPIGETVIHAHRYRDALTAISARKLARRPDVRIIATRHKSAPGKNNRLRRFIYRNIDQHIFVSDFAKRVFLSSWPEGRFPFDSRRLHVVYNSRRMVENRLPLPEKGAITAMCHGILRPGKGLETIIDALQLIKSRGLVKVRLKIVGSGEADYIDSLRQRAIIADVMDLIDWIRNTDDPSQLVGICHFGVLPAMMPEACGLANIEYMMGARAQITTFNGAQPEYLTPNVEALEVQPGNVTQLADAITRLAGNPQLRLSMGQAAAKRYDKDLAWSAFIKQIAEIYEFKFFKLKT